MRTKLFVLMLLAALALPMAAKAETITHLVKKGETASGIAKKYGITVKDLGIKCPKGWVYIGQRIEISKEGDKVSEVKISKVASVAKKTAKKSNDGNFYWKVPGGERFVGSDDFAFDKLELRSDEVRELKTLIKSGRFVIMSIGYGDKFDAMVFGKSKVRKNVVAAWDQTRLQAARVYRLTSGREVWWPYICHNWSIRTPPPPPLVPDNPELVPPPSGDVPPSPTVPPEAPEDRDIFDLIMGAGLYEDANGADHTGGYVWIKGRYFPLTFTFDDFRLDAGLAAFYAGGSGDDTGYGYDWDQYVLGPAARFLGAGWDANVDLMYGVLYNNGGINLYESRQKDDIFILSLHYNDYKRRQAGELWFPKTELNLEYRHIFDASIDASYDGHSLNVNPNDNGAAELTVTPYIYDFRVGQNMKISPLIDFGLGYEQGGDKPYARIMPGAALSIKDIDVLQVRAFGYKDMLNSNDAQINWLAVTLDFGGAYKAYRLSKITEPERSELIPVSKSRSGVDGVPIAPPPDFF